MISFNVRVRYFAWNFKGMPERLLNLITHSLTQNILPIHWNIFISFKVDNLRALWLKTPQAFWKLCPCLWLYLITYKCDLSRCYLLPLTIRAVLIRFILKLYTAENIKVMNHELIDLCNIFRIYATSARDRIWGVAREMLKVFMLWRIKKFVW